jgi:ribonucleotide reductase class II
MQLDNNRDIRSLAKFLEIEPHDLSKFPVGSAVFYRSYSRPNENGYESWTQCIKRSLEGLRKLGKFTDEEFDLVYRNAMECKTLPSGRWMWCGGSEWIEKQENFYGGYNCTSNEVDEPSVFGWLMGLAMQGCGTGAILEQRCIDKLPPISRKLNVSVVGEFGEGGKSTTHIEYDAIKDIYKLNVGDSRQGWVDSYQFLIDLAMRSLIFGNITDNDDDAEIVIDISNVRESGKKLKGFGGTANPIKLKEFYLKIANLLNDAYGRQLTAEECCLLIDEAAIVVVAGNVRRCLPEDALVHTERGLVKIKDVKVGELVQTPYGFKRIVNKFYQGEQEVRELLTNSMTPRATENHRYAVYSDAFGGYEWKRCDELKSDDRLIHNTKILHGIPTALPEDFTSVRPVNSRTAKHIVIPDLDTDIAWLIGFTHGNGHVTVGKNKHNKSFGYVNWTTNSTYGDLKNNIVSRIERAIYKFGLSVDVTDMPNENTTRIHVSSIRLAEYFQRFIKKSKSDMDVPDFILQGFSDIRAAYLAGIMDSDGAHGNRPPHLVTSIYPNFTRQLGCVLSSLGIAGRLSYTYPKEKTWNPKYSITIPAMKEAYNKIIAPHSLKGELKIGLRSNGFSLPNALLREQFSYSDMRSMGFNGDKKIVTTNYESYVEKSNLELDVPVTFKELGTVSVCETYDIEVEDVHCFYCDGYLTHNSAGMRQFGTNERLLKNNLWQQDEEGNWSIDPKRDALRMANHTRVFHSKPDYETIKEAVTIQFQSGEGAIQYVNEAIARANVDIFNTPYKKLAFLNELDNGNGREALESIGADNVEHRLHRYGLNPCFRGDMRLLTVDGYKRFDELDGTEPDIINFMGAKVKSKVWCSGEKETVCLSISNRQKIYCTPDHRFLIFENDDEHECEAKDLLGKHLKQFGDDGEIVTVTQIESAGIHKVYDFTEPVTHWGVVEGFVVHNCG